MGQKASVPNKRKKNSQDANLLKLDEKIALVKQNLYRNKQMGEVQSRTLEDEIYDFEMKLYKTKDRLHRKGENAKQYLSFWEYVEVVNMVLPKDSSVVNQTSDISDDMTLEQHRAQLKAQEEKEKQQSSAIMNNSLSNFNIYSFFEAFLLRRLHIAMLLKHQRASQSKVWNDVIIFMFNKIPGMKQQVKTVNKKYSTLRTESNKTMKEMQRLQKKKLKLYEQMVTNLEEEIREEGYELTSLDQDKSLVDEKTPAGAQTASVDTSKGSFDVANDTAKYYQKGRYEPEDDEMSFRSSNSRNSRKSRAKRRESSNSSSSVDKSKDPLWKKSSSSKLSKVSSASKVSQPTWGSQRSSSDRSPSPAPLTPPRKGDNVTARSNITDDDIEKFLYPRKIRTSLGGRRNKAPGRELPSELEFGNGAAPEQQSDEVSSIGSESMRTSYSLSGSMHADPKNLTEVKAKKKEVHHLMKSMEAPGEEGEEAIEQS